MGEASAAADKQVDGAGGSIPGVNRPGALRLVLGGHSRGPPPYGPRLCAQHQSLHANIATAP